MESKKEKPRYHHFSHDHSLEYTKLQPHKDAVCSGCTQPISPGKFYYKCKVVCGFYLHQVCFNMPENVTHPSDPNHNLTLETFPTPSKVPIRCKSCENPIKGFYYSCSKCIEYYHTLCLAAPLSIKTPLHRHSLNIEFVPVYDFQCDLCDKPSYSGWVYHCNLCEFDAHLSCVLTNKGSVESQPHADELPQAPVNGVARGNQRRDELMELLIRSSNLPQNQDQSMQSFQLSEACFSIDFQNSLMGNDGDKMKGGRGGSVREVAIPEDGEKSMSRSSSVIGAHIWTELEQATEKRNSKAGDKRLELTPRRSSSTLPKFTCCFHIGKT